MSRRILSAEERRAQNIKPRLSTAGKPNGPLTAFDTGEPVVNTGNSPLAIAGGYLTHTPLVGPNSAGYAEVNIGGPVGRIGATFRFPQLAGSSNNTVTFVVPSLPWGTAEGMLSNAACHFTITPTNWDYSLWQKDAGTVVLASGTHSLAANTDYDADAYFEGNTATFVLPDGTVRKITDSRIASWMGTTGIFEVYELDGTSGAPARISAARLDAASSRLSPGDIAELALANPANAVRYENWGGVDLHGNLIANLADPLNPDHASNKRYVDTQTQLQNVVLLDDAPNGWGLNLSNGDPAQHRPVAAGTINLIVHTMPLPGSPYKNQQVFAEDTGVTWTRTYWDGVWRDWQQAPTGSGGSADLSAYATKNYVDYQNHALVVYNLNTVPDGLSLVDGSGAAVGSPVPSGTQVDIFTTTTTWANPIGTTQPPDEWRFQSSMVLPWDGSPVRYFGRSKWQGTWAAWSETGSDKLNQAQVDARVNTWLTPGVLTSGNDLNSINSTAMYSNWLLTGGAPPTNMPPNAAGIDMILTEFRFDGGTTKIQTAYNVPWQAVGDPDPGAVGFTWSREFYDGAWSLWHRVGMTVQDVDARIAAKAAPLKVQATNPGLTVPGLWIETKANGDVSFWIENGS